jgi:hypothetical protein
MIAPGPMFVGKGIVMVLDTDAAAAMQHSHFMVLVDKLEGMLMHPPVVASQASGYSCRIA